MTYFLSVSRAAFEEIRDKLLAAGYEDQICCDEDEAVIDMHGIALQAEDVPPDSSRPLIDEILTAHHGDV